MATIQEKLAESLEVLKEYQDAHGDNLVIQGAETLGRTHTERLVNSGYLQMVIKGWYIPSSPGSEGDSTVWYVSYWSFVTAYLDNRFEGKWCLSPELSLDFYSGKTVIPEQLIVRSELGTNNILQLPFGTSLVDIKASLPPEVVREPHYGVRLYPMEYALLMVGPDYYRRDGHAYFPRAGKYRNDARSHADHRNTAAFPFLRRLQYDDKHGRRGFGAQCDPQPFLERFSQHSPDVL